jgi:RecA/RadA recombinase
MIIELFGPPGCGKTTFAHTLAERLRRSGHEVALLVSSRPGEEGDPRGARNASSRMAAAARLIRPVGRLLSDVGQTALHGTEFTTTRQLLQAMPPRGALWSIRLYRYALHLNCAWRWARQALHPVVVDQGFAQLLGSMVLLSGITDRLRIANVLQTLPVPDLLIHLKAPDNILRGRLAGRMAAQGWLQRRLELSTEDNLRFAAVLDDLCPLLRQAGWEVISFCSTDTTAPCRTAALVEERLAPRQTDNAGNRQPVANGLQSRGVA